MATIKDIARAAGVSHATVSNVLNHKGNVSAQKVKLVMDTAAAMGYHVNEAASALRSGSAQILAVILPDTGSAASDDLYRSLCQAASENGYSMLLRLTNNVPGTELKAIQDVLASRARCVVVVTSLSDPVCHYDVLRRAGIRVVFALRGAQEGYLYAGFDLSLAAEALARRVCSDGAHSICLMTEMTCYPSQAAFRDRFLAVAGPGCRVTSVESISSQYGKQAFALLGSDHPDAVVVTNHEMAHAVLEAGRVLGIRPRMYALAPQRVLHPSEYTPYELNYRRLGLELGRMLTCDDAACTDLKGEMPGFSPRFRRSPVTQERRLSLFTADTPVTRALERLLPRLKKDTGLSLTITTLPTQQANPVFAQPEQMARYDLARMDLGLIDRWAAEYFVPLDQLHISADDILPRLLPGLAQEYSLVNDRYYGLPLDPGCHLLFYREDLFGNPHIQRRYYELFRKPLSIPSDYESFLRTAQFFNQIDLQEYGVDHSLILTRRSSECLSCLAPLSDDGCLTSLTEAALEHYIQHQHLLEACADFVERGSWNYAVSRFARGQCALLIAYSNYTRYLADEPLCAVSGQVGYAPSPSGKAFRGGGMIGVMKTSPYAEECALFLDWLYSPGISQLLAMLSGCSPLSAAYDCTEITDIYPWLDTVRAGLLDGVRRQLIPTLHAPLDRLSVEEQISELCARAVAGELTASQTLDAIRSLGI